MLGPAPTIASVEVIKVNGKLGQRFFPCGQCVHKNTIKSKLLEGNLTHQEYIRWQIMHQNIKSGQGQRYTAKIGFCSQFTQQTGTQGGSQLKGK